MALALAGCKNSSSQYDWNADLQHRLACDFDWTQQDVKEYIQKLIPDVTDEQIEKWTADNTLESMMIDGERMYFNRTASNLFRVDPECKAIKDAANGIATPGAFMNFTGTIKENAMSAILDGGTISCPKKMKVKYTLTVDADAVPAGEIIRCWLPFPRTDVARQTGVSLISASEEKYTISDPSFKHTSLYMEKAAVAGQPTVFEEEFEYTASSEYYPLSSSYVADAAANALGKTEFTDTRSYYDTTSDVYKEYTSEREAHIVFSERLKALAAELTEGLENPYDKAKAIFTWVSDNFPWAGAREYSTIENIPEYVLDIKHGDCGQVTLLFCTLCRIEGIPTHFQSGWTVNPEEVNLHDWAEIYFEGLGWVPVDQSHGLMYDAVRTVPMVTLPGRVVPEVYTPDYPFEDESFRALNDKMLYFSLGGIDSYRLIVNQDYGKEFSPAKKYPRSETVDFQRGEVEWAGGNLYFDQWDYHMDVKYL